MKRALFSLLVLIFLTSCYAPVDAPPPPTSIFTATAQPALPTPTVQPSTTSTSEAVNAGFCQDPQTLKLVEDLKIVLQNHDGALLASLVSSKTGLGVRFLRNGNVITYFDNVKFVFETTYEADWGLGYGSGAPVKGSFQQIVLPSLELVFGSNPTITCNELKYGGVTYVPEWPYQGMDFYSAYFSGVTDLSWETWAIGMVYEEGKPKLAALVHYVWEP